MRSLAFVCLIGWLCCGCALVQPWQGAPSNDGEPKPLRVALPLTPSPPSPTPEATAVEPLSRGALWAHWNALRGDPYALDSVERRLEPGEKVTCDPKAMLRYTGTHLRYAGPLLVSAPFKERLARFEAVAASVAREVYGREPRRIRHFGAYSCRSTRNRKHVVSEHALGNAVDVVGFDFGPATKAAPLPDALPRALRGPFQISVARHWAADKGATAAVHARFLSELTERLREQPDIFRSMFGPGHGGHDDHLHLDVSPWRYVDL
jgi:hypothetical protein